MHYRPYRPIDFPALYAIEEECFQPPLRFGKQYMRNLLSNPASRTWLAEENDTLAGFAIVELNPEPGSGVAYIQTIEVAAAFRRRGIASALLDHVEQSAQEAGVITIWLHVDSANTAAISLYLAHGFTRQGTEPHYYARRRDAEILAKPLRSWSKATPC